MEKWSNDALPRQKVIHSVGISPLPSLQSIGRGTESVGSFPPDGLRERLLNRGKLKTLEEMLAEIVHIALQTGIQLSSIRIVDNVHSMPI